MARDELAQEWILLQSEYDSYEKYALLIKLAAVLAVAAVYVMNMAWVMMIAFTLVFWLQDAIWKTFQGRIETRLLALETALAVEHAPAGEIPFQFNRDFQHNRPGFAGLVIEYLKQALRPTVAYPYGLLILLSFIPCILN